MTETVEAAAPEIRRSWQSRLLTPDNRTADNVVLGLLLAALTVSFYYAWFRDPSHEVGGFGWHDQTSYTETAQNLIGLHWPTYDELHYQPGYSILGAFGTLLSYDNPFWFVSYALLISSAIFCYRACRTRYNIAASALFLISMFVWDGRARSFGYVSELFAVPWNNQVLFFAFAFFFWLYTVRRTAPVDTKYTIIIGALCGFVLITREEGIAFVAPLAAIYLIYRRTPLRTWLITGAAAFVVALPGLVIKWKALGSVFAPGPGRRNGTYSGQASRYFSPGRVVTNVQEVLIDSGFAAKEAGRHALLESSPWLWLGFAGVIVVLVSRRFDGLTKAFVAVSLLLMVFYLSGNNVSAAKLKYHCLRYMSPAYISLHFGVIVALVEGWRAARRVAARERART